MNKKIINIFKAFTPAILWAVVIYLFSAQEVLPGLSLSISDFLLKKTAHIFVFAVLYLLMLKGFSSLGETPIIAWKKTMLICLMYAIIDELHQTIVPGRTGTIRDVGYDFLGISIAFMQKFNYI
jgi:VanZ family protein